MKKNILLILCLSVFAGLCGCSSEEENLREELEISSEEYATEYVFTENENDNENKDDKVDYSSKEELLVLSEEEQYDINIFLSNFSEQRFQESHIWDEEEEALIFAPSKFEVQNCDGND